MSADVVRVPEGPDAGMVLHTGDPFGEQRAMSTGNGVLHLGSREVFTVTGPDRLTWLHSLSSQDLAGLRPGMGVDALVLSPNGHVEHGFVVVDDGEHCWCWTEPGAREGLLGFLESMKFWTDVRCEPRDDLTVWWIGNREQAPEAVAIAQTLIGDGRLMVLPGDVPVSGRLVGQWAHEALRVVAGVPRIGADTDARTLPNEIGLHGTALDKGCYRGQETVARVHNLGRPPRRLVRLLFDGDLPTVGAAIMHGDKQVGVLTSPVQHYELGPVGLSLVKRSVPVDATLVVSGIAAAQEAIVDPGIGEHFRPQL